MILRSLTAAAALTIMVAPAAAQTAKRPAKAPAAAPVASAEALEAARAVVDIAFPAAQREQIFGSATEAVADQLRANARERIADPGLRKVVEARADGLPQRLMPVTRKHIPRIVEAITGAYSREFSLDELKQIRAFAETPAGQHYISRNATLLGDPGVAAANRAYLAEATDQAKSERAELAKEVDAYIAKSPQARPRPAAPATEGR